MLLFVVGVVLMTTEAHPEARPRLVVGSALLALGALGLVHIGAGLPAEPERWHEGGGAVGYLAAIPLASGLTAWVAVPVLLLLSGYAFLLLIDTPLREVPDLLRRLTGRELADERRDDAADGDRRGRPRDDLGGDRRAAPPGAAPAEPPAAGRLRRAARRGRAAGGTRRPAGRDRRAARPTPPSRPAGPGHPARRDRGGDGVGEQLRLADARRPPAARPTSCRRATCCPRGPVPKRPAAAPTTR